MYDTMIGFFLGVATMLVITNCVLLTLIIRTRNLD